MLNTILSSRFTKLVGIAATCGLCACVAKQAPVHAAETPEQSGCNNDARAQRIKSGFTAQGRVYSFTLDSLSPESPASGANVWTLHVSDKGHVPVTRAKLTIKTFMPDHGHGGPSPTVSNHAGSYRLRNLNLFMPGIWQVTVDAQVGRTTDSATFTFCIPG